VAGATLRALREKGILARACLCSARRAPHQARKTAGQKCREQGDRGMRQVHWLHCGLVQIKLARSGFPKTATANRLFTDPCMANPSDSSDRELSGVVALAARNSSTTCRSSIVVTAAATAAPKAASLRVSM
jgi:hypothetical protein